MDVVPAEDRSGWRLGSFLEGRSMMDAFWGGEASDVKEGSAGMVHAAIALD